jgi:hypothetical protein
MSKRGKTFQVKAGPGSFTADVDVDPNMMLVLSHCEVCGVHCSASICGRCEKEGYKMEFYPYHR